MQLSRAKPGNPASLTMIELAMYVCITCVRQETPRTADVTVTKMAGYVPVRILMNR